MAGRHTFTPLTTGGQSRLSDEEVTILAIVRDNEVSSRILDSASALRAMRRQGLIDVQDDRLIVAEKGVAALKSSGNGSSDGAGHLKNEPPGSK